MAYYNGNRTPKAIKKYTTVMNGKAVKVVRYDSLPDPKGQVLKGKPRKPTYRPR
tara:strand:- start:434 stop:595 length:162 start_codon:yes stop_codon:yes gene_type:complete